MRPVMRGETIIPDVYDAHPAMRRSDFALFLDDPGLYEYHVVQGQPRKSSAAMEFGTLVDRALLVPHWRESIVEIPADVLGAGGRRAGARWKEFESAHAGAVLCKPGDPLLGIARALAAHKVAAGLLDAAGDVHAGGAVVVDSALGQLGPIKAQADKLIPLADGRTMIVDLKTSADASPRGFAASVAKYRYHVQQLWYQDVFCGLYGEPAEQWPFVFVVMQTTPPYRVEVYDLDQAWLDHAARVVDEAAERFAACAASGVWARASADTIVTLGMPEWVASTQWEVSDGGGTKAPEQGAAGEPAGDDEQPAAAE